MHIVSLVKSLRHGCHRYKNQYANQRSGVNRKPIRYNFRNVMEPIRYSEKHLRSLKTIESKNKNIRQNREIEYSQSESLS